MMSTRNNATRAFAPAALAAIAACVLAVCLVFACALIAPAHAFAKKSDSYTYTVRVLGGNQGTVNGKSIDSKSGLAYGSTLTLADAFKVTLNDDSKYYVKGFRLAGQDNLDGLHANITVTEDTDFVVSYGMKGSLVSYTIHFVERDTKRKLADDVTYQGNKGDKPVVAYEYVSGYRPLYRNLTGTLGEEGTNEWTFEYVPLAAGQTEDGTTTTNVVTDVVRRPGTTTNTTTTNNANQGGNDNANTTTESVDENGNEPTEEILDQDNPLANGTEGGQQGGAGDGQQGGGVPTAGIVGGAAAALALIAAFIAAFFKRRRENAVPAVAGMGPTPNGAAPAEGTPAEAPAEAPAGAPAGADSVISKTAEGVKQAAESVGAAAPGAAAATSIPQPVDPSESAIPQPVNNPDPSPWQKPDNTDA